MRSRYTWLSVSALTPSKIEKIKSCMLENEYSEDNGWGYILDNASRSALEGRLIERREIIETSEDPFGRTFEYKRLDYKLTTFEINLKSPHISLINPPRSVSSFINSVAQYTDYSLEVDTIEVDVMIWLDKIEKGLGKATVPQLSIVDIYLSNQAAAQILLKGTCDVRGYVDDIVKKRRNRIDRVQAEIDGIIFELVNTGRAILSSLPDNRMLHTIRECLADSIKK